MVEEIVKLTAEQEAILPRKKDEWVEHGLSTAPANRAEAERGVRLAYEAAGLDHPRFFIWVDSPYAGAFAQALAPSVIEAALEPVDKAGVQIGAQVRVQVGVQVRAQVGNWNSALISDYYAIWWSSWIDTMQALGVDGLMPWNGQRIVAQNAYWWWAFRGFVASCQSGLVRSTVTKKEGCTPKQAWRFRGLTGGDSTRGTERMFRSG